MTFSDRFQDGQVRPAQPNPQAPNRQVLPTQAELAAATENTRAHLELSSAEARRVTGQVAPGDPIPQPPAPLPMSSEQGLNLLAQSLATMAIQMTRITAAVEETEKRSKFQLAALEKLVELLKGTDARAEEIHDLVRGFTDDGASFRTNVADPFTACYAAVVSPLLAIKNRNKVDEMKEADLLKAGAAAARDMVEEIVAFREYRQANAATTQLAASSGDPWGELGR